jgi:hypothetical protein
VIPPGAVRSAPTSTPLQPARFRGAGRLRLLPAALALVMAGPALAAPAAPATAIATTVDGDYPRLSEDDELILELRTPKGDLTDTITAHGLRGGIFLPLGDLSRILDLSIRVSDEGHYASGWFLAPARTLSINLRSGTITLAGKDAVLRKSDFTAYDGELWIRAERLSEILPIALTADLRAQTLLVRTLEPFPYQQRLARDAERDRLANLSHPTAAPTLPLIATPYRLASMPVAETELRAEGNSGVGPHLEADVRASGDLLFMTARVFATLSSTGGLVSAHLQLGRRDPDARLLGPLHATEFELGDIATTSMPLGLRGVMGRGFTLTNEPIERVSVFDTMDFRGPLADGFEVELYRNDTLIGSTREAVNGQYAFLKVPVDFGINVFRLVFYGPQGQRHEDVRRISVGDGRLARGAFTYNLFAAQKDMTLANAKLPAFVPTIDYGDWREGMTVQYGLTGGITMVGSGAVYQSGGLARWLGSAGLRTGLFGWAARIDAAIEHTAGQGNGTAIQVAVAGRILGTSLVETHADYTNGFVDEVRSPSDLPLKSMNEFDLSRTLHLGTRTIPLVLTWQHLAYADGQETDVAMVHQTLTVGRVMASNVITYLASSAPGSPPNGSTTGTFDLSTFAGRQTQYRAEVSYTVGPHPGLAGVGGEWSRDIDPRTSVRASLSRTFADRQNTLGLSATRKFGAYALSFDGSYTAPSNTYALTLRLGFSFGRDPLRGRLFVARPGLSGSGAVAVRAFADTNGNGRLDPGEAPLGQVTFRAGSQIVTTDNAGNGLMTAVGDGTHVAIRMDSATLPDIAMAPTRPAVETIARPGPIPVIDFPVQRLSDIEATAVYADGTRKRGVAGLMLQLIRADGRRIARARSASDGFVLIEQVRPGDYRLDIDPDQARNLNIHLVSDPHIHVGTDGKVVRLKIIVASRPPS